MFSSINDAEILKIPPVRLPFGLHPVHVGVAGPLVAPGEHAVQYPPLPFEEGLHPAVRQIPHPPRQPPGQGLIPGMGPEKNPLNPALDEDMEPRFVPHLSLLLQEDAKKQ